MELRIDKWTDEQMDRPNDFCACNTFYEACIIFNIIIKTYIDNLSRFSNLCKKSSNQS